MTYGEMVAYSFKKLQKISAVIPSVLILSIIKTLRE